MATVTEPTAAPTFAWKRFPEAESFLADRIASALAGNAFAAGLARRMSEETSTRFADWVDHLVLTDGPGVAQELVGLGFTREPFTYAVGAPVYGHQGGIF